MQFKNPSELWQGYCEATPAIRQQYGVRSALQYLVGEKLMSFAHSGESAADFLAELPPFSAKIRKLFSKSEIEGYFEAADRDSRIDPNILTGASADELEDLRDSLDQDRQTRERRQWVKAMLLREGS